MTATPAPSRAELVAERDAERASAYAFWLFWSASTASLAGDTVTAVALPLAAIVVLHASTVAVGLLTAASFGAWVVLGLPAGAVVQRWPVRTVQVTCDLARAIVLLSIPVAAWLGALSIAQLIGAAFAVGIASVVFDVANSTFIVSVVATDDLTRRNSFVSGGAAVTQMAGPSAGGVLVSLLGAAAALAVDVGSYLLSALLLSRLPCAEDADRSGAARVTQASVAQGMRDGIAYVFRHPVVGRCTLMATVTNFVCGGVTALGPLFLVRTLHAPLALTGVLLSGEGVGTLCGAAAAVRLSRRQASAGLLFRATALGGLCALLMPLAGRGPWAVVFVIGSAGFAAGVVVLSILARTHRQETTPRELLPQVMATVRFVSWGVIPVGAALAGVLAELVGIRDALALFSAVALIVPAIGRTGFIGNLRDLNPGS